MAVVARSLYRDPTLLSGTGSLIQFANLLVMRNNHKDSAPAELTAGGRAGEVTVEQKGRFT